MKEYNFELFKSVFDNLLSKTRKSFNKELNNKYDFTKSILTVFVHNAIANFYGVTNLCYIDENIDVDLYLNASLLNRSLFDILFQIFWLFENEENYRQQFYEVRLKESKEINEYKQSKSDVTENEIDGLQELKEFVSKEFGSSINPNSQIKKRIHPSTNQIKNSLIVKNSNVSPLVEALQNLYYIELSQLSHSQPTATYILHQHFTEFDNNAKKGFKNDQQKMALIFLMCILSEIEIHLNLGLKEELLTFWSSMKESNDYVKEFYEMRYKEFLSSK